MYTYVLILILIDLCFHVMKSWNSFFPMAVWQVAKFYKLPINLGRVLGLTEADLRQ